MGEVSAKIFVSYSRADSAFAGELVSGIEACGFDAFIDKADIAHGEAWQSRLGDLIHRADTIIWIVSPASLASEIVAWELQTAAEAAKRIIPVSYTDLDIARVPDHLRQLNFCFFRARPFGDALKDLATALRTDVAWLREHTRIADLARRWDDHGRAADLLLRGRELEVAREWSAARPSNAPPLTDAQAALIAASNRAQEDADRNAKRRTRRIVFIASAIALLMTGLAGASGWLMLQARQANEKLAVSLAENMKTTTELEKANLNLTKERGLAIATVSAGQGGKAAIGGGWFVRATQNLQSLIRIEEAPREDGLLSRGRMVGTGFVIKGGLLHPEWGGMPVIVTAQHVVNPNLPIGVSEPYAGTECLGSAAETETCLSTKLGEPLFFSSSTVGAAVYALPLNLAPHVQPIDEIFPGDADQLERMLGGVGEVGDFARRPLFALSYGFPMARDAELIFMEAYGFGRIDRHERAIWMAHATEPGMSGAPVFLGDRYTLAGMHTRIAIWEGPRLSGTAWIGDIIADIQENYRPDALAADEGDAP